MSSTYRILCLSHDPATTHGEYTTPEDAEHAISGGLEGHPNCDLAIGCYSYPLVEVGCPPSGGQPATLGCNHGVTRWMDGDWLIVLTVAYESTDPAIRKAAKASGHSCWPWERLRRLRAEFGLAVAVSESSVGDLTGGSVAVCTDYLPPATASDSGLCARCGMFDYRHSGPSDA